MQIIKHPDRKEWKRLLQRPEMDTARLVADVEAILHEVKIKGDAALKTFNKKFDGVDMESFQVDEMEWNAAEQEIPAELKGALQQAGANIKKFHQSQLYKEEKVETMPGVQCWRKSVAIDSIGLYIPGGTAPLFSTVLMLGIPANLAGCREIIVCTPCNANGKVHPAILFAARLTGVSKIFKVGGAQAIAAMAFGTESIPAVSKIFGPGNPYVTVAKQLVQKDGVAIDIPAGPSEVCVLADHSANAEFIAADLLSQAEHGPDSQVMLVSTEAALVEQVLVALEKQVENLPRKDVARKALVNSKAFIMQHLEEGIELVNAYAAEHLIISCRDAGGVAEKITNAGSVFIGNFSPESAGDYASGTNHTLPTHGYARSYSGVSVDSFVRKITFQQLTEEGLRRIAPTVMTMAEAEGLMAHSHSVMIRMNATAD